MKLLELEKHMKTLRYFAERVYTCKNDKNCTQDDVNYWESAKNGYMKALENCFEYTSDENYTELLLDYYREVLLQLGEW